MALFDAEPHVGRGPRPGDCGISPLHLRPGSSNAICVSSVFTPIFPSAISVCAGDTGGSTERRTEPKQEICPDAKQKTQQRTFFDNPPVDVSR